MRFSEERRTSTLRGVAAAVVRLARPRPVVRTMTPNVACMLVHSCELVPPGARQVQQGSMRACCNWSGRLNDSERNCSSAIHGRAKRFILLAGDAHLGSVHPSPGLRSENRVDCTGSGVEAGAFKRWADERIAA